jgi:hypothetical protein
VLEQPIPVLVNVLWSNTESLAFMSRNLQEQQVVVEKRTAA